MLAGVAAGSFQPIRIPVSGSAATTMTAMLAVRIGAGQRATLTPMRRQRRPLTDVRGSSQPRRPTMAISAGVRVSEASIATRTPTAQGIPVLRNIPTSAKLSVASAAAMVSADPTMTGVTPRQASTSAAAEGTPRRRPSW